MRAAVRASDARGSELASNELLRPGAGEHELPRFCSQNDTDTVQNPVDGANRLGVVPKSLCKSVCWQREDRTQGQDNRKGSESS